VEAGCCGACCGAGEGEAGERGHDEGLGGFGLFGLAEQEADTGSVDAGCVGVGGLGDDDAGLSGCGEVGDGAEFEPETTDVDGGGALALAEDVGYCDLLGAEAFGDANRPLATHGDARRGRLGENAARRGVGGVEAIFEMEDEAEGAGLFGGVGEGEASEVGHFDLATMDGEPHGDECGEQRDYQHRQRAENDVEEAVDPGDLHCFVRIYGDSIFRCRKNRGNFSGTVILPLDLLRTLEGI